MAPYVEEMKTVLIPETLMECVAVALREWRESEDVTQVRLAGLLDVSQATMSRIERGTASLALDSLLRLSSGDVQWIAKRALEKTEQFDLPPPPD